MAVVRGGWDRLSNFVVEVCADCGEYIDAYCKNAGSGNGHRYEANKGQAASSEGSAATMLLFAVTLVLRCQLSVCRKRGVL